jgi:NTP pyrophosphatase (non-canonical NTP hydrolase)
MSLSNLEAQLLGLITEEAAEVIQIVSKIQRFGLTSYHPRDPDKVQNRYLLMQELGDLQAVLDMLYDTVNESLGRNSIIVEEQINGYAALKKEKLKLMFKGE